VTDIAGYLGRLGIEHPGAPSVEALHAIHRAHIERIAYSSIDIHLGQPCPLEPTVVIGHLVRTGRGGYCFQQNAALFTLLTALGYDVRRHRGSVFSSPDTVPFVPYPNHMALTVHGLPGPAGGWLADAGLGDALHGPLPLEPGVHRDGPLTFTLERTDLGWRFHHDASGSFLGMDFSTDEAPLSAFEHSHQELSTSAASSFVRACVVARRTADDLHKLRALSYTRLSADGAVVTELTTVDEWRALLADRFATVLTDEEAGLLWPKLHASQEAWRAQQQHA
jgi:arylamine N-acetyltransferase